MNVQIKVVGQKLILPDNSYRYISGSRNFIYIVFNLDSDWNNMNVCAEFAQENNVYSYLLDNNNGIHFPSGIEPGVCKISLRGSKDGVTATTDSITLYVDQYSGSDGDVITTYFVDTSEGNVTEDDIPVGKIAFSKGVRIEGKHVCKDGVTLPDINNAAEENNVFFGKEYIDGDGTKRTGDFTIDLELTEQDLLISQINDALNYKASGSLISLPELGETAAKPTDMLAGKVLYDDDGNPVTGTLVEAKEIQEKLVATSDYSFSGTPGGTVFSVAGKYNADIDGVVVRRGAGLGVRSAPTEFFGNAAASNVAKGKTFTSAAGLLVEGELEEIAAGEPLDASEGIIVNHNSDGTITISAKTNFGDNPDAIIRNGAYLRITVSKSDFEDISGSVGDVTITDETLVFGEGSTATIENDTLVL